MNTVEIGVSWNRSGRFKMTAHFRSSLCSICKGENFWESIYGVQLCSLCHPPACEEVVSARFKIIPYEKTFSSHSDSAITCAREIYKKSKKSINKRHLQMFTEQMKNSLATTFVTYMEETGDD